LQWLNTTGGPFVCGEPDTLVFWRGVSGNSIDRSEGQPTDYDRACAVSDYMGVIPCGIGKAIVLGDDPMQTALISNAKSEPTILRWMYCRLENKCDVLSILEDGQAIADPIAFKIIGTVLTLFDSSGTLDAKASDVAKLEVTPNIYAVTTEKIERRGVYSFIAHRFIST
jgi:Immunity protein 21